MTNIAIINGFILPGFTGCGNTLRCNAVLALGLRVMSKIGVCPQNQASFSAGVMPKTFAGSGISSFFRIPRQSFRASLI